MPELIPPPGSESTITPTPISAHSRIVCEYCECQLAPSGQVMRRGPRATEFMALSDRIDQKEKEIAKQQTTIAELEETIVALRRELAQAVQPAARKQFLDL